MRRHPRAGSTLMTRYFMSEGANELDVFVEDDTDLNGAFDAICAETGERLRVRGWMISQIEEILL